MVLVDYGPGAECVGLRSRVGTVSSPRLPTAHSPMRTWSGQRHQPCSLSVSMKCVRVLVGFYSPSGLPRLCLLPSRVRAEPSTPERRYRIRPRDRAGTTRAVPSYFPRFFHPLGSPLVPDSFSSLLSLTLSHSLSLSPLPLPLFSLPPDIPHRPPCCSPDSSSHQVPIQYPSLNCFNSPHPPFSVTPFPLSRSFISSKPFAFDLPS